MRCGPADAVLGITLIGHVQKCHDDALRPSGFRSCGPAAAPDPAQGAITGAVDPQCRLEMGRNGAGSDCVQHDPQGLTIVRMDDRQRQFAGRRLILAQTQHRAKFSRPAAFASCDVEIPNAQPRRLHRQTRTFLAVRQRAQGELLRVHILQRAIPADNLPLLVAARRRAGTHPAIAAIAQPDTIIDVDRRAGCQMLGPNGDSPGQIVRVERDKPAGSQRLLRDHAGQVQPARSNFLNRAIGGSGPRYLRAQFD